MYANGDATKTADAWSAAQQQMWEGWLKLMQSSPLAVGAEQWQKLSQQSIQSWLEAADPTVRRVAEQMMTSQQALTGFLQMAAGAWQEVADRIAAGDDPQTVLADFSGQMRRQLKLDTELWADLANRSLVVSGEMWQSYGQPWIQMWQQAAGRMTPSGRAPQMSMFGDLVGRTFDVYQQTFGRFLDTPPLGYAREYEEKVRKLVKANQEYIVATVEYQAVMNDAWVNGMTKLMEALVRRAQAGTPIRTIQEISEEWAKIADPAFYEVFVSEKYVRAQGKLLSATMAQRIAQRQLTEQMAERLDMPTRTEVDAAHKAIYQQRRDLRALKKELAAANAKIAELAAAQSTAPAAAPPATVKPAKPRKASAAKSPAAKAAAGKSAAAKTTARKATTATTKRTTKKSEG